MIDCDWDKDWDRDAVSIKRLAHGLWFGYFRVAMAKLRDVNTSDIADAVRLGCRTMGSVFNADDNDIPFFVSRARPNPMLGFNCPLSDAHVPGRHLNALLSARDVLGIEVEEAVIEKHTRAAFFSYSGPIPLPLARKAIGEELSVCDHHNIREGFHALYASAHFMKCADALELADRSARFILEHWSPDIGWNIQALENQLGHPVGTWKSFITEVARAIGPLVKLYRATGLPSALELAIRLKEKAIDGYFTETGAYDREIMGHHTHSVTCTMSSLAQLADLTSDSTLMNRVIAFYDNGLWDIRDQIGWVIESTFDDRNPDRGECNNTGDIVETALILGRWGYTKYFEDAERMLRCHLLPSQLRDVSFIEEPDNPNHDDGLRDVADRHRGAFGFPAPYGHEPIGIESVDFNMDIVGGSVGSLCEVWREAVRTDAAGHRVNLHFDRETEQVAVTSPYPGGTLRVMVKKTAPLFVRIPSWVGRDEVALQGYEGSPCWSNGYLLLPEPPVGEWISITVPLKEREIVLQHKTRNIRVQLRGDEVMKMEHPGADLTFFPVIAELE